VPPPREHLVDEASRRIATEDAELLRRLDGRSLEGTRAAVPAEDARAFARRFAERHRDLLDRLARERWSKPGSR
jgi:hypothetical protein